MIISRTPYRISFFGGGSDYPEWYLKNGGCVISSSINKFIYISCRELPPYFQYKHRIVYSETEMVQNLNEIKHAVIRSVLNKFKNENHPKLYWARIDWILSDGETDIPMHKDILVRMSDKQQLLEFPFTGSTLRNLPPEGYLKYKYRSIRLTLPKEASRTGVKLYFTSTY